MVSRPWNTSRLSCGERLLLRSDRNAGNSFPNTLGKDPSSRARRRNRGSSGYGRDSRASLEWRRVFGKLLELQQGCEGHFGSSRGLVSLASRRLSGNGPHLAWRGEPPDFLEWRQVLLTYDGNLRDPLWWPQERPVPMRFARGPLGIPLQSMLGPETLSGFSSGT